MLLRAMCGAQSCPRGRNPSASGMLQKRKASGTSRWRRSHFGIHCDKPPLRRRSRRRSLEGCVRIHASACKCVCRFKRLARERIPSLTPTRTVCASCPRAETRCTEPALYRWECALRADAKRLLRVAVGRYSPADQPAERTTEKLLSAHHKSAPHRPPPVRCPSSLWPPCSKRPASSTSPRNRVAEEKKARAATAIAKGAAQARAVGHSEDKVIGSPKWDASSPKGSFSEHQP